MRKKTIETIPVLSVQMQDILNSFARSRSLPSSLVKRAQIILMSSEGKTNLAISSKIGISHEHAATWRNRFPANVSNLQALELIAPDKLSEEIRKILSDEQRPGSPPKFTPEQITKIINLACQHPQEYGYEVSHWSLSLLVKEIVKSGIAEQISAKSVSRFLKSGKITTT